MKDHARIHRILKRTLVDKAPKHRRKILAQVAAKVKK